MRLHRLIIADLTRVQGPDHPQTLVARRRLAVDVGRGGDPAEAARLLRDVIPRLERVLGSDHGQTESARQDLRYFTAE